MPASGGHLRSSDRRRRSDGQGPNRPSLGRPGILDRDRLHAGGRMLDANVRPVSSSRRQIGAPAFALISFHKPGLEQLGDGPLGLAALRPVAEPGNGQLLADQAGTVVTGRARSSVAIGICSSAGPSDRVPNRPKLHSSKPPRFAGTSKGDSNCEPLYDAFLNFSRFEDRGDITRDGPERE